MRYMPIWWNRIKRTKIKEKHKMGKFLQRYVPVLDWIPPKSIELQEVPSPVIKAVSC